MATRIAAFDAAAVPVVATAMNEAAGSRRREIAERALRAIGEPALAWARAHDDEEGFSVLVDIALHTPLLPAARPLLAARLPRRRAWLHAHLQAGPPAARHNPGLAVLRLLGRDAAGEGESLCALLDARAGRDWELAVNVSEALGRIEATSCGTDLARALEIPSWRVTAVVLETLARLGSDDPEVRRRVLRTATSHWSRRIRWRAVTTLRFLREPAAFDEPAAIARVVANGGTAASYLEAESTTEDPVASAFSTFDDGDDEPLARIPACAAGRPRGQPVEVRDGDQPFTLPPLGPGSAARLREHGNALPSLTLAEFGLGQPLPLTDAARDAVRFGASLLVALCAEELGGGLLSLPPGSPPQRLRQGCFESFFGPATGSSLLWVFEGPGRLGSSYGRLWRLERVGALLDLTPFTDLPATASAAARWGPELFVATRHGDVAIANDGSVRALACAPP